MTWNHSKATVTYLYENLACLPCACILFEMSQFILSAEYQCAFHSSAHALFQAACSGHGTWSGIPSKCEFHVVNCSFNIPCTHNYALPPVHKTSWSHSDAAIEFVCSRHVREGGVPGLHRHGWVSCTGSDYRVIISVHPGTPHICALICIHPPASRLDIRK